MVGVDLDVDVLDGDLVAVPDAQPSGPHLELGLRRGGKSGYGGHVGDCGHSRSSRSVVRVTLLLRRSGFVRHAASLARPGERSDGAAMGTISVPRFMVKACPRHSIRRLTQARAQQNRVTYDRASSSGMYRGGSHEPRSARTAIWAAAVCTRQVAAQHRGGELVGRHREARRRDDDRGHHRLHREGHGVERPAHLGPAGVSLERPGHRAPDVAVLHRVERRPGQEARRRRSGARACSPRRARRPPAGNRRGARGRAAGSPSTSRRSAAAPSPSRGRRARGTCTRRSAGSRAPRRPCARPCPRRGW